MMIKRVFWIVILFLVLAFVIVPAASATTPTEIDDGVWTFAGITPNTVSFCFFSDGNMDGCATQPLAPKGRAVKGHYSGLIGGEYVECEYNLAAFSLPNGKSQAFSLFTILGCTDGAGNSVALHMQGKAYDDGNGFYGSFGGRYHFDPPDTP